MKHDLPIGSIIAIVRDSPTLWRAEYSCTGTTYKASVASHSPEQALAAIDYAAAAAIKRAHGTDQPTLDLIPPDTLIGHAHE